MNILITGVHGFVGSNLVKALASEHQIYGLDIISPVTEGVIKTYSWDSFDDESRRPDFPGIDAVIHLAGKAHDTRSKSAAEVYFMVNTGLTQKIFDWYLAASGVRKFIFFSTAKAAAERVSGILTENVVPAPVGPYGESKIAAENYILSKGDIPGKQVYIFRPCMIHGPGNKGNLNLLYGVVSKGIPWPLGAFDNRRTFTSVDNMCYAVSGVLSAEVPSGIYNMCDDEAISTNELIEIICRVLGRKVRIWRIPRWLMNTAAQVSGWLHLPLNPLRMQKLTENYISSNAKIKTALGLDCFPVDARTGLEITIKSFAERK